MIDQAQARSLAVRYSAFNQSDLENHEDTAFWGQMLLDVQRETGVEIHPNDWLERIVARANRMIDLAEAA